MGKNPPAFQVYEEDFAALLSVSDASAGEFIKAAGRFFYDKTEPTFSDEQLKMLFNFVRPKLKRDYHNYYVKVVKRSYAAYIRDYKKSHGGDETGAATLTVWFLAERAKRLSEIRALLDLPDSDPDPLDRLPPQFLEIDRDDLADN